MTKYAKRRDRRRDSGALGGGARVRNGFSLFKDAEDAQITS